MNPLAEIADHGGNLERARALFPHAPGPWVDLSTGINPHPYPLFDLPATAFTRLPEPERSEELVHLAATAYAAPSPHYVAAAPGTQSLLPIIARMVPKGRAYILGPTYAEHARAAALAGHAVEQVDEIDPLAEADLAVVVNPNNPDGRLVEHFRLIETAERMRRKGGLLVVDEAFMDVASGQSMAADVGQGGVVVLRSFGKFFGLAGLRLGFAIADTSHAAWIKAQLGPWAVSGPALEYGLQALSDIEWQNRMRERLAIEARGLDALLLAAGLPQPNGTALFRFLRYECAARLFEHLGRQGILTRAFSAMPDALRLGLPATGEAWQRLETALLSYKEMHA